MKRANRATFFVVALLLAAFACLSLVGISTQYGDIRTVWIKGASDVRWGIDIRGGVDATFTPPEGYVATADEMDGAKEAIARRLIAQNITDYELYVDYNKNRVIVRFPWKADEEDFDPARSIQELGETALLTFREGMEIDPMTGAPSGVTASTVILSGQEVANASARYYQNDYGVTEPVVLLNLNPEGATKFAEATGRLTGQVISIWMDDEMISYPTVQSAITGGEATITGLASGDDAKQLADRINAGSLPFRMQADSYNTISPTLGGEARDAMVMAGIIAFIAVAVLMVFRYRLPGVISVIALAGQVALVIASITGFFSALPSFTLTLPGIAGIILSIGFGVDANVITAERIKEELATGKTIDGAVDVGFKRAFSAILDGNVTVIIVAIILMGAFGPTDSLMAKLMTPFFFMFGPAAAGNIYSFGYTLLMGVLANLIMGVLCSRLMLKSICRQGFARRVRLYGGEEQ